MSTIESTAPTSWNATSSMETACSLLSTLAIRSKIDNARLLTESLSDEDSIIARISE